MTDSHNGNRNGNINKQNWNVAGCKSFQGSVRPVRLPLTFAVAGPKLTSRTSSLANPTAALHCLRHAVSLPLSQKCHTWHTFPSLPKVPPYLPCLSHTIPSFYLSPAKALKMASPSQRWGSTSTLLMLCIVLTLMTTKAHAFGAGNIPSIGKLASASLINNTFNQVAF